MPAFWQPAGRSFRAHGYGGIGVDGLARAAEVTSGAFYGHFTSKCAAFKAAVIAGLEELRQGIEFLQKEHPDDWLKAFAEFYLGPKRACDMSQTCTLPSLTPEVERSENDVRAAYEAELQSVVATFASGLSGGTPSARRAKAWAILGLLAGGLAISRAVPEKKTADEIATAVLTAALTMSR
jgi:TetR/AcrR family transcriptional regulator, transcriptional repressor for nem operon